MLAERSNSNDVAAYLGGGTRECEPQWQPMFKALSLVHLRRCNGLMYTVA